MATRRPKPARPGPATKRTRRDPRPPTRTEEVLEAALELIADHGVAGASLRHLAKKLGMSQPSLYHYFSSKDELVSRIIQHSAERMLGAGLSIAPPKDREDLPRFVKDAVLALYATDSHPRFVRFLFIVSIESKRHRPLIDRMFEEQLNPSFGVLAQAFARDDADREEITHVLRMIVYSVGFMLLDERALRGLPVESERIRQYAEWVAGRALEMLARSGRPS